MDPSNQNRQLSQDEQWQDWAARAQEGDRRAYNALLKEILPFIKTMIGGSLANPDWVDEIAQEVLISVHKSLHTYSPGRPFRPWLNAIIFYRRADFLRRHYSARRHKQVSLDNPEFINNHVTESAHAGEWKDVEAALGELPPKQRRIFELLRIRGYTAKEVAGKLGMTVTAVKVSAHRTMHKLKSRLE